MNINILDFYLFFIVSQASVHKKIPLKCGNLLCWDLIYLVICHNYLKVGRYLKNTTLLITYIAVGQEVQLHWSYVA